MDAQSSFGPADRGDASPMHGSFRHAASNEGGAERIASPDQHLKSHPGGG